MRAVTPLVVVLLLSVDCGSAADVEEPGTLRSAITDGWLDPGHPSVGALHSPEGFVCTATLVGARSVLTAAHCLSPFETAYRFVLAGRDYAVVSAVPHPSYDPSTKLGDLGILRLDDEPPVEPSRLSLGPPAPGTPIVVVGLGCAAARTKDCVYGTKRMTTNIVARVSPEELVFTSTLGDAGGHCDGDSGGPSYVLAQGREVLVGVHAWGPSVCEGDNHDARVDGQLSWIRQQTGGDVLVAPPGGGGASSGCAVGRAQRPSLRPSTRSSE